MLRPFGLCAWLAAASGPRQIKAPKTESWWSHVDFAEQRSLHPVLAYCPTTANERVHNAACLLRLSSLCKSASPLASAIDPRRNSNICNCCSLGRCKDAGASGRSADWVVRRALRNVLPATLSGPRAGATMVTHKGALLLARCHASAAREGLRASSKGHRPHRKIKVTSKPPVGDISVVTLIRRCKL